MNPIWCYTALMIEVIKEDPEVNTAVGRDVNGHLYWRTLNGKGEWHAYPTEAPEEQPYTIDLQHLPIEYAIMLTNDDPRMRKLWQRIRGTIPPG